ncbi:LysE family translocator [Gordonia sp. (in: high G+C Gram-positive bacteria)]|uniref:LysE family translocator n=1 Tax=Gordonia sp. (in: high G+C Gram-positive bacteria) TaxID=84139 RepID=UPI00260D30BD|nr:LysE family translocator [Gordonia sp. (in: high G+C Gram-positive bacteria)]
MMSWLALVGFLLAIIPVVVTPGASFTLVTGRSLVGDRAGAVATIVGTATGILTHALLAAAGLALLVMQSAQAYTVVRLVGAAYLIGLGVVMLVRPRRTPPAEPGPDDGGPRPPRPSPARNVKAAAVYLTLAPQFVPAHEMSLPPMLTLAGIHVLVMAVWLASWAEGLRLAGRRFDFRTWITRIHRLGGVVLIVLGLRTAVARS